MVLWLDLSFICLSQSVLCMCVHVCHFPKVLARKILRKSSKICTGVLMSGEKLMTTFVGGEWECRKSLIQAHSEAALGLKRPIVPGAWGEKRDVWEPSREEGTFPWVGALHPMILFSSEPLPHLSPHPPQRTPARGILHQYAQTEDFSLPRQGESDMCVWLSRTDCTFLKNHYPLSWISVYGILSTFWI